MPPSNSRTPENPAVPPPPVGGAAVGYELATGDGDGDGLGDGLAPGAEAAVAVGDAVVVGTAVAVVVGVGDAALAVPLYSPVDDGDTLGEGDAVDVDPAFGRGDPEPVQALIVAHATSASRVQPIKRNVRTPNEPPHPPGGPQADFFPCPGTRNR